MSVSEFNTLRDHAQRLVDEAAAVYVGEIARLERRIAALEAHPALKKPAKG